MNLYDFDNTIFKGDSSVNFYKYSLARHPFIVFASSLKASKEIIKYIFKKSNIGYIKSELFSYVKHIKDLDTYVNNFILKESKNIKKFYLENQKEDDVIISASFDFLIVPFCKSLGIKNIIATKYDVKKGSIIGNNCKGEEKVIEFKKLFKDREVNEAYSDSLSDIPMLSLAKKAYLVKDNEIIEYNK